MYKRSILPKPIAHYPEDPTAGKPEDVYYNSVDEVFKKFDGTAWVTIGADATTISTSLTTLTNAVNDFEIKVLMGVY